MNDGGAFDAGFARRKRWRVDPGLFAALVDVIPRGATILDCGAGLGRYVRALRLAGYLADGVDGIADVATLSEGLVREVDLSVPQSRTDWPRLFEWAISIEVGEHVPADRAAAFLDNIAAAARRGLIVSWAVPGQRGRSHVNCRPPGWVMGQIEARGWRTDVEAVVKARAIAGRGWNRKLLVFRR